MLVQNAGCKNLFQQLPAMTTVVVIRTNIIRTADRWRVVMIVVRVITLLGVRRGGLLITIVIVIVVCRTNGSTGHATDGATNRRTFQGASALIADHRTSDRTCRGTQNATNRLIGATVG